MKKKQLTALLLSAAMALSLLSGCGGNAASSGSSTSQESTGETESQGIREYTAFFAVPGTEINDDNEIQAAIADITGARVKETWLTGQTAQEAVGTMIAGGEYPDFIDGSDGQIQLYEAGALVALDDYLDKYPNIKEFYSDAEWDKVRQEDGKIYWIPQFGNIWEKDMSAVHSDEAFWIQTRVLKWAGYPEVKTMDQYFDLIESYNEANPSMEDGTANIPYTILCDDWRYFCLENAPQFLDGHPNDGSVIVDTDTLKIVDYNTKKVFPEAERRIPEGNCGSGILHPDL